jgi:hypothetical protein
MQNQEYPMKLKLVSACVYLYDGELKLTSPAKIVAP